MGPELECMSIFLWLTMAKQLPLHTVQGGTSLLTAVFEMWSLSRFSIGIYGKLMSSVYIILASLLTRKSHKQRSRQRLNLS